MITAIMILTIKVIIMKKALCLITAMLLLCAALAGCGSDGSKADEKQIDTAALTEEMQAAAAWPQMLSVGSGDSSAERGFSAISTLAYDKIEAFSLLYAADGTAYELALIRLKDPSDMPALEQSLKTHIEKRTEQYRYYKPEQVSRAESAAVAVHGSYAALIMCDGNAAVKAVFDKAFA